MQSQAGSQKSASSIYSRYYPQLDNEYSSPHSDKPDIDEELRRLKQEQEQYTLQRSSLQGSPILRSNALNLSLDRHPSIDEYANPHADEQWGDPYASTHVYSPPMSASSFKSKSSVRSRGSHRAPRKVSTPARFEPNREGRPLDSPMTATTATSPVQSSSAFPIAQSMTSYDGRSLSIVPSIAPTADDRGSLSIVPSAAPTRDDQQESSILPSILPSSQGHPSSVNESHRLDASILQYSRSGIDRNASIASNRTIPQSIFNDFDGVHLSPLVDEEIQEEHEDDYEQKHAGNGVKKGEEGEAFRPTGEYELWFHEQFQRAEQHGEADIDERQSHHNSLHGETEDGRKSATHQAWAEPPPEEGMHYYPAPVPKEIKLPQRLSRQFGAEKVAKRRSQALGELNSEARKSATWLPTDGEDASERAPQDLESPTRAAQHKKQRSSANLKKLPPQLRASLFFDHEPVAHHVEMKDGSATATLEHMLDASVMGPPTEELDLRHPDAIGKRRKSLSSIPALENDGRTSRASMMSGALDKSGRASKASMLSGPLNEKNSDGRMSRASMFSGKRSASVDNLAAAGNRSSSAMSLSRFSFEGKRNSSALELEHPALRVVNGSEQGEGSEYHRDVELRSNSQALERDDEWDSDDHIIRVGGEPGYAEVEEAHHEEGDEQNEKRDSDEFDEAIHGPPTTLLAELQLRKQKLKQRNRTAVSAFPNGMHSTLLEMDAVAQIEKKRRKGKPTTLAWEDPSAKGTPDEVDDDDVPLGVLFPEKNGLTTKGRNEWDKPLGLLQQKERDENEPLSNRRNRLFGTQQPISAQRATQMQQTFLEGQHAVAQHANEESEHEGETLAQRTRRLRSTRALDEAIGRGSRDGTKSQALSDDFASEMMSTFGPIDKGEANAGKRQAQGNAVDAEVEGETLGQRRKRLQLEAAARQASGGSNGSTPMLQSNPSMGNLLAQVPQSAIATRNVSGETGASSGLLGANDEKQARERQQIADKNFRSGSGMGINGPLVDAGQNDAQTSTNPVNRGGAGKRQTFMPGQYSALRSPSSQDLLRDAQQQSPAQPQQPQNPWQGIAPQSFAQGFGAVGSNFQQNKPANHPFPHFPGNAGTAMFANDPKGGVVHQPNRGSMLWSQEQAQRVSMLPRQWTDGNFGFMGNGAGKTYAAQAQIQQPSSEQIQTPPMSDLQRAKIEQWRTSILH